MIVARAGSGWQTVLSDLSLILFMVTASALSNAPKHMPAPAPSRPAASPLGEPLALYRADAGSPPLADWLALQAPDARQQLSITVPYGPGGLDAAMVEAGRLARAAGSAGPQVRIIIETGDGPAFASLAYDAPHQTPQLPKGPLP